jgi:16S rRNA (uracil1498-N3)-methyltransferase
LRYFFVNPERVFEDTLLLDREEAHHVKNVLRMGIGEVLHVSDGFHFLYRTRIANYTEGEVLCSIREKVTLSRPPGPEVTLLQSIPKGKRLEWLIQKCTEVGVSEVMPVLMQRSVRTPAADKADAWTQRCRRIAHEAAKQCGRLEIPLVQEPSTLEEAIKKVEGHSLRIFLYEQEEKRSLRDLRRAQPNPNRIALVVGPEGGITREEVELLSAHGFVPATLGDQILRTETAGILSVALVRYEWTQKSPGSTLDGDSGSSRSR